MNCGWLECFRQIKRGLTFERGFSFVPSADLSDPFIGFLSDCCLVTSCGSDVEFMIKLISLVATG